MMVQETVVVGTPPEAFRISWGAVFAGTFVALGVWILLHALGMAAGLTAIDADDPSSLRGVGIGTGIWSIIAPLIALFVGGFVATRSTGVIHRGLGALHGAVLWGLTTVLGALLVAMAIASVVSAGVQLGRAGAGAAARMGPMADALNLDFDDALAPINQRLQAQGSPPLTSAQISAATRDVVQSAVRTGRIDRAALVNALDQNTALSRPDAEQLATRMEAQIDQSATRLQQQGLRAAEATGKAFWGVFLALLLGLISAIVGGVAGVTRRQRAVSLPMTPAPLIPPERQVPVQT